MSRRIAKQGKKFFLFVLFFVLGAGLIAPAGFSRAKTIDIDGVFSDWDNVATLVDEEDFTGSSAEFSADGTTYYYNTGTDSWQTTEISNACKVNYEYMIAVDFIKMTNDNNYLYLLWERGTDFMDYRWETGNYYTFSASAAPATAPNGEFSSSPPCAGHIITAPAAFDHDMVISVDKNKDGAYDYYLVINVQYPAGWDFASSYDTAGYIFEDDGNGVYDGRSSETLKTTFGDGGFEIGISSASNIGVRQEWKMSIDDIFSDLGISWGDSVNVRYEAHSTASDVSEAKAYAFERNKVIKLKTKVKKRTRNSTVRVSGRTKKNTAVKVFVNGEDRGSIRVTGGGRFAKRVSLDMGANTIRVEAAHATKGSKSVTKTVTRR